MKQPEQMARDGVVIARVAHIQKAQQLFIEEIEPEEAVVFARRAAHGKDKIRRIAQRG